ncbi:HAD-like domain-containing protein [Melanogaster broomeanus]|nr:HAD-like domain-containing protein [Melanogaster broomeanus]
MATLRRIRTGDGRFLTLLTKEGVVTAEADNPGALNQIWYIPDIGKINSTMPNLGYRDPKPVAVLGADGTTIVGDQQSIEWNFILTGGHSPIQQVGTHSTWAIARGIGAAVKLAPTSLEDPAIVDGRPLLWAPHVVAVILSCLRQAKLNSLLIYFFPMSEASKQLTAAQPSKKRDISQIQDPASQTSETTDGSMPPVHKVVKVHPFFSKPSASTSTTTSGFQWLKPSLGPKRTCLHGINLSPPATAKVAAFDLDGTVIKSRHKNRGKGAEALTWEWWRNAVPGKLQDLHQDGYSILLISNQALKAAALEDWKKKIPLIAAALPTVPFRLFAACAKDGYRKPMPGMWYEIERIFKEQNVEIGGSDVRPSLKPGTQKNHGLPLVVDKDRSFFVGDAAGRVDDFASTDRKWAINIGIPFYTPEEYFLALPHTPYKLPGFHVSGLSPTTELLSPSNATVVPKPLKPELVLFTGFPSLGKSSFYHKHFAPVGYTHVNQDTLGTRAKCVKAAEEALRAGKSCVIDNTNRDVATRKFYVDLAKTVGVPARCFLFTGSMELAWHNNLYRAYNQPSSNGSQPTRDLLPYLAFIGFRDNYEEPQTSEGLSEVIKVNWVFEGDEEATKRWNMWLQIDGK